ncbi:MAG TPA: hypothetical protein VIF62_10800 [Labilithrix sp.]
MKNTIAIAVLLVAPRALAQEPELPPLPAPTADEPPSPPAPKPKTPVGLRLDGGYATRRLFDLGVSGADLGLAVGPQPNEHLAAWAAPRLFLGSTDNGLSVWSLRVDGELEYVVDRLRLGGGVGAFVIGVHRAARDETLLSYGPEARITARFDIVKNEDLAFFLRGALDCGGDLLAGSLFWGPSIGAGMQFELVKPPSASP